MRRDELSGALIPAEILIVRIDKKKLTAQLTIEYFITDTEDPLVGRIRILFHEDFGRTGVFPVVEGNMNFPGTDLTIHTSIAIWWSNATGLREDKIMVCDGQVVTVQLVPDPVP